jgi:hypothetical protein
MVALAKQVVGNVGMYFAAYQLSRHGWNVMPTSRNARGIDLLAYDSEARRILGIQIKTLSLHGAVPLGRNAPDHLLGDWWIIVTDVAAETPVCFLMAPMEVTGAAVQDKGGDRAFWLAAKAYSTDQFREAWQRIGSGFSPQEDQTDIKT